MARTLGPGKSIGTAKLGWTKTGPESYEFVFGGDHTAMVFEMQGTWVLEIFYVDMPVYKRKLGTFRMDKQALDEATTELLAWFFADVSEQLETRYHNPGEPTGQSKGKLKTRLLR